MNLLRWQRSETKNNWLPWQPATERNPFMKTACLLRRIAVASFACCLMTLVALPSLLAADDLGTRDGLKSNSCEGRSLALKGEFVTAIQILPPFPSFPPGPFQPILNLLITANGMLSHFGQTTAATTDQAVDLSVIPNQGTGHWVFQNTKGDALWTEMDLIASPPDAEGRTTFRATLTVIGGAGKFAGATGTLQGEGAAQGNAGVFSVAGAVCVTSADGN